MSTEVSRRIEKRRNWWKEHKKDDQHEEQHHGGRERGQSQADGKKHSTSKSPIKHEGCTTLPMPKILSGTKRGFQSSLQILQKVEESSTMNTSKRNKRQDLKRSEKKLSKQECEDDADSGSLQKDSSVEEELNEKSGKVKGKKSEKQFVAFIGNLPYNASKEKVQRHFGKVGKVKSLRFPVNKETGKPKGFAFIEFEDRWSFKRALLLHHSKMNGRQINVEFTSIGGNTKKRKEKLKQKNSNLERFKRPRPQGPTS